jgi:hypothetical protein
VTRYECTRCRGVHHDASSKIGVAHAHYGRPIVSFTNMGPVRHIEEATALMREVTADHAWTPAGVRLVESAARDLSAVIRILRP